MRNLPSIPSERPIVNHRRGAGSVSTTAFQRLSPCVDDKGHRFAVSEPEPGNFGYAKTYCTRCGKFRSELQPSTGGES